MRSYLWVGRLSLIALAACAPMGGRVLAGVTPSGDTTVAPTATDTTTVGNVASGTLVIDGGSALTNVTGVLAASAGSTGTMAVSGAGSTWTNSGGLYIGKEGAGFLNINAGGQVSAVPVRLGYAAAASGTVTVTGSNSTLSSTSTYVGMYGNATLNMDAGGQVTDATGYIGYYTTSTASATVAGSGSIWSNTADLYVGYSGDGTLNVEDGGQVSASTTIRVGYQVGSGTLRVVSGGQVSTTTSYIGDKLSSTGVAVVAGAGSVWNHGDVCYVGSSGSGTLNITGGGRVNDRYSCLGNTASSVGVATVSGPGSLWDNQYNLNVGFNGVGMLTVENGGLVQYECAYIGKYTGSTGTITVRGVGSTMRTNNGIDDDVWVGWFGKGFLNIEAGGHVYSTNGVIGESGSRATVTGPGSLWEITEALSISYSGGLVVSNGGKVAAKTMTFTNSPYALRLHISGNDMIVLGNATTTGTLTNNNSTISFLADAFLPPGIYRPITDYSGGAPTFSGMGTYKPFGGVWNTIDKTFSVAVPTPVSAGAVETITSSERLLITDAATGKRMGASFQTLSGTMTFSACQPAETDLASLITLLGTDKQVLAAWDFTTSLTTNEVMLSFEIGTYASDLSVWRLQNGTWTAYTPLLMSYEPDGVASFTVNAFSGYAIAGTVPEPSMAALLVLTAVVLMRGGRSRA